MSFAFCFIVGVATVERGQSVVGWRLGPIQKQALTRTTRRWTTAPELLRSVLIESQAAWAWLIGNVRNPLFTAGSMACPSQEGRRALKSRMILSWALKGHTNAKKRSEEVGESTWKNNTTQAGPVCHLTSQWSGRLRAAHVAAAHRRVRPHERSGVDWAGVCAPGAQLQTWTAIADIVKN